jgi:hypothetical protein
VTLYERYLVWLRLTHGGRRDRSEMSGQQQLEFDGLGVTEAPAPDPQQAQRLYVKATQTP